jgi:hypothetical protein
MKEELKVTPNHKEKTFTIRKDDSKFRTSKMNKEEFDECLYNTNLDWINFLRVDNSYYLVK